MKCVANNSVLQVELIAAYFLLFCCFACYQHSCVFLLYVVHETGQALRKRKRAGRNNNQANTVDADSDNDSDNDNADEQAMQGAGGAGAGIGEDAEGMYRCQCI